MTEKYEFIDCEAGNFPVQQMCTWAGVSTSGFYHWRSRPLSATAKRRAELRAVRSRTKTADFGDPDLVGAAVPAAFKRETLKGRKGWSNEHEARLDAFRWLTRYNTRRRHSRLGQRSPIAYENDLQPAATTLAQAAQTCSTSEVKTHLHLPRLWRWEEDFADLWTATGQRMVT